MTRPCSRNSLVVSLFVFLAVTLSAAQMQVASLHSDNGLVWQRTSPTAQKPDGPVLYQLLFSTAGIPNQISKFDTNPRHLTNSLLSDNGSIRVGTGNLFAIASNGIITFASGQTFPGGGAGTVTSVGLAAPVSDFIVSGSPVTGTGTLTFNWNIAPATADTASAIVKRDASGNFGANTITLDGNLALPSTASGTVGVLTIGGAPFLHSFGSPANTFVGLAAGNLSLTGALNTVVGNGALSHETSGDSNTAIGVNALYTNTIGVGNTSTGVSALNSNTQGGFNTAIGMAALFSNTAGNYNVAIGRDAGYTGTPANANTTGSQNTFVGYSAGPGTSTQLTNATAIGSNAKVSSSNSLVLGDGTVNVGVGTPTPGAKLDVSGTVRVGNATTTGTTIGAIQAGTATLGTSLTQEAQFTVTFPSTFASVPHVIVTARAADATVADVFAVSTRSISTTQFVINIIRLDMNAGWGQNLQLDWFAWQ
ncbi:MAG TPA: H-type lectin domain-containing protein [Terriglobales bacterium]|jgi:hypothetical protein|nr:H-type lectin domain-containing protein [Terriglobales bacterium]